LNVRHRPGTPWESDGRSRPRGTLFDHRVRLHPYGHGAKAGIRQLGCRDDVAFRDLNSSGQVIEPKYQSHITRATCLSNEAGEGHGIFASGIQQPSYQWICFETSFCIRIFGHCHSPLAANESPEFYWSAA